MHTYYNLHLSKYNNVTITCKHKKEGIAKLSILL